MLLSLRQLGIASVMLLHEKHKVCIDWLYMQVPIQIGTHMETIIKTKKIIYN